MIMQQTLKENISNLRYLMVLTIPVGVWLALSGEGIICYLIPFMNFIGIPLLDFFLPESKENLPVTSEERVKSNRLFDWILYINVPCQYFLLFYMLTVVTSGEYLWWESVGKVWSMGICSAVLGINTAHELGHRQNKRDQWLAKLLLLTCMYAHFFIEHNRGHHKYVATPIDPATARRNEPVFLFYFRSIFSGYLSAWNISNNLCIKQNKKAFSLHNEMIRLHVLQLIVLLIVYLLFSWQGIALFLIQSVIGILVLETINYVEHYGLFRKKLPDGTYEKIKPHHSWNSDHILGRVMLLELTRHSDHHYKSTRKYQLLRHFDGSPQLPLGYPGSMVLAWIPPLWFYIMNKRIDLMILHQNTQDLQDTP